MRLVLALMLFFAAADAQATRYRRPFDVWRQLSAGYDNRSGGGCHDYACRGRCYDVHTGNDFGLPMGTAVVAAAPGVVTQRNDSCNDWGYYGNQCGGRCGNYVRVRHADGADSLYCHMKRGTIAVGVGQQVGCGQYLGQSASSGSSTGPHLHFGWRRNGWSIDAYAGPCSNSNGNWVAQNGYNDIPSTTCETTCACSPGQVHREGCGRCGYRQRVCGGNCQWGGWSGCLGEGPCSPGQRQEQACCDCGRQARSCGGNCHWGGWSACAGADPSPAAACDTGQPGVCADGQVRCISGCRACIGKVAPSNELCDALDNDCDGDTDEGQPRQLGTQRPAYAAAIIEASAPAALRPGEVAEGWVVFRNEGTRPWLPGTISLRLHGSDELRASVADPASWASSDAVAALRDEVAPGAEAMLPFTLRGPDASVAAPFSLVLHVSGEGAMKCPSPDLALTVATLATLEAESREPNPLPELRWADPSTEAGCASASAGLFALLALAVRRRRESPRRE